MPIAAVYFDIGETVLDRSREYAALAREIGIKPHTFSAVFGAVVARGGNVAEVPALFGRPDLIGSDGGAGALTEADLYPDARACLERLQNSGLRVGIAGNQAASMTARLRALDLPADDIATSGQWRVAKPDPRFFENVVEAAKCEPHEVVYVGDQLKNDVLAAADAGLQTVRILRGPWGALERDEVAERHCLAIVHTLTEVADLLAGAA